jgi:hypothetical protein
LDRYPPHCAKYRKFGPVEITRGCIYACKFYQTPFVNNEAAGRIDIATQKHLKKLTAQGKAYGKWKEQIVVAEKLSGLKKIITDQ